MGEQARGGGTPPAPCLIRTATATGIPPSAPKSLLQLLRGGVTPPGPTAIAEGGIPPPSSWRLLLQRGVYSPKLLALATAAGGIPPLATAQLLLLQGGGDPLPATAEGGKPPPANFQQLLLLRGGVTRCAPFSSFSDAAPVYILS